MANRRLQIDIDVEITKAHQRLDKLEHDLGKIGVSARQSGQHLTAFQRISQQARRNVCGFCVCRRRHARAQDSCPVYV